MMMFLGEAVYKLTESELEVLIEQQRSIGAGEAFLIAFAVGVVCVCAIGMLAYEEGKKNPIIDKSAPKKRKNKLMCECGRKATHFVNVNGLDQPVCALHAQEILANV